MKVCWGQVGVVEIRRLESTLWEVGSPWRAVNQPWEAGGNPKAILGKATTGSCGLPSTEEVLRDLKLGPLHQHSLVDCFKDPRALSEDSSGQNQLHNNVTRFFHNLTLALMVQTQRWQNCGCLRSMEAVALNCTHGHCVLHTHTYTDTRLPLRLSLMRQRNDDLH